VPAGRGGEGDHRQGWTCNHSSLVVGEARISFFSPVVASGIGAGQKRGLAGQGYPKRPRTDPPATAPRLSTLACASPISAPPRRSCCSSPMPMLAGTSPPAPTAPPVRGTFAVRRRCPAPPDPCHARRPLGLFSPHPGLTSQSRSRRIPGAGKIPLEGKRMVAAIVAHPPVRASCQ
jgi:hypothetical protein